MIEIKFKIYDKELKETHIEELQDLCEDDYWYDGETDMWSMLYDGTHKQERFVISLYTGLKDINDVEIYENDIVSIPVRRCGGNHGNWYRNTNENHGWLGDFIYKKVVYHKVKFKTEGLVSGFRFEDLPITKKQIEEIEKPRGKERTKQNVDIWNFDITKVKIIGNIYENPELLEGR